MIRFFSMIMAILFIGLFSCHEETVEETVDMLPVKNIVGTHYGNLIYFNAEIINESNNSHISKGAENADLSCYDMSYNISQLNDTLKITFNNYCQKTNQYYSFITGVLGPTYMVSSRILTTYHRVFYLTENPYFFTNNGDKSGGIGKFTAYGGTGATFDFQLRSADSDSIYFIEVKSR